MNRTRSKTKYNYRPVETCLDMITSVYTTLILKAIKFYQKEEEGWLSFADNGVVYGTYVL